MSQNRLSSLSARKLNRGGFTLVELLVVIGIIAILAGVALGPITSGIEKAKENTGMQAARQINLLMFAYSNDNNQTYLPGSSAANPQSPAINTSEGIANALLNGSYASDPTIFAIISAHKYTGATAPFVLTSGNVDFDFTGGATSSTGITSTASDQLPLVFSTGSAVTYSVSSAATLTSTAAAPAPFKLNGIAVAYKSNSATFIKGSIATATTATVSNFISASYNDTGTYSQIKP